MKVIMACVTNIIIFFPVGSLNYHASCQMLIRETKEQSNNQL